MHDLIHLFGQTGLKLYPDPVAVVGLHAGMRQEAAALAGEEGLLSLVFLPDEITLVLTEALWQNMCSRFPRASVESGFRLLTLDVVLPWNVVGYLAGVTKVLAAAGISVGVISSYASDHLLLRQNALTAALRELQALGAFKTEENGK